MLYKYPQREFPYARLVDQNARRKGDPHQPELELLDIGIFDDDRYFDVFVEYAKAGPEDILMRVTLHNRGPEEATIHLLPQLWSRNTWTCKPGAAKPLMQGSAPCVVAEHPDLGRFALYGDNLLLHLQQKVAETPITLFSYNETNGRRLFRQPDAKGVFKDAFDEYIVHGNHAAVNPEPAGTKAGVWLKLTVPAGGSASVRLRLTKSRLMATPISLAPGFSPVSGERDAAAASAASSFANKAAEAAASGRASNTGLKPGPNKILNPFAAFDAIFAARIREADEFYGDSQRDIADADARDVQRQAFAGLI
jgi:hypothetical protein